MQLFTCGCHDFAVFLVRSFVLVWFLFFSPVFPQTSWIPIWLLPSCLESTPCTLKPWTPVSWRVRWRTSTPWAQTCFLNSNCRTMDPTIRNSSSFVQNWMGAFFIFLLFPLILRVGCTMPLVRLHNYILSSVREHLKNRAKSMPGILSVTSPLQRPFLQHSWISLAVHWVSYTWIRSLRDTYSSCGCRRSLLQQVRVLTDPR